MVTVKEQPRSHFEHSNGRKKSNSRIQMTLSPTVQSFMLWISLLITSGALAMVPISVIGIFSELFFD